MTRLQAVLLVLLALLTLPLASCESARRVSIVSPAHGSFVEQGLLAVEVEVRFPHLFSRIDVNGIPAPIAGSFTVGVPVDAATVFQRITVTAELAAGGTRGDTVMVVVTDGVTRGFAPAGSTVPEGVALRVADEGLGQIAPVVEGLSSEALDVSEIITAQNPIAQGSMSGIGYTANVVEVGFGGFGLGVEPTPSGLSTDFQIDDFFLEVDLDLGWLGSCTLEIETSAANLTGSFDLSPLPADPSLVDVDLVSPVGVQLAGFGSQFVSGICDDPVIGDIIDLILGEGEIQQLMQAGFEANLADPDGAGPDDSVLADAIEQALAGVSIAGPIGEALGGVLDASIVDITEEASGLTIAADSAIYTTTPHPGAPDLPGSYTVAGALPGFGALTPDGGLPYGMAFAISVSAMNQLLMTQIENGLLYTELTEFAGLPLTAALLAPLIPNLTSHYAPATPLVIVIEPTLAPVFSGAPGPNGELAELMIGALEVSIAAQGGASPFLVLQVDLDAGVDLDFTQAGLEFVLTTPEAGDIAIEVKLNQIDTPPGALVATFQTLFPLFAPELENAIEAFPVPALLGLELDPVEVAWLGGGYIGLFADLVLAPTTRIENVVFTDLSSGDFRQQGGCWLREWRHRLSGRVLGNTVETSLKGMLGADAGCTTNDAQSTAVLSYRVNLDVVSVPGEEWTLDIDHALLGALDRISDGYNDGIGFQDGGGSAILHTDMEASWAVEGGGSGSFDFAPSVSSIHDGIGGGSTSQDVEFRGSGGASLVGTGDASVEIVFSLDLEAYSNSNTAFPTANGDEMAIRLGKNDTIDDHFTAGGYPGMGSRNIADDGHSASIVLSSQPLP